MASQEEHEESCELSKDYIKLLNKIQTDKQLYIANVNDTLTELITESEKLFDRIQRPSTLKLDARLLTESTTISSINFEKTIRNNAIDTQRFISLYHNDRLDEYYSKVMKKFNGIRMYQLFVTEYEENQNRRSINRNKITVDTEPEIPKCIHENLEVDINKEIPDKIQKLVEKVGDIEYYRLVVDKDSFGKTIENMFYLAFAVKLGKVSLCSKNSILYVSKESRDSEGYEHLIVDFTYDDYKNIIEKLNIQETFLN